MSIDEQDKYLLGLSGGSVHSHQHVLRDGDDFARLLVEEVVGAVFELVALLALFAGHFALAYLFCVFDGLASEDSFEDESERAVLLHVGQQRIALALNFLRRKRFFFFCCPSIPPF